MATSIFLPRQEWPNDIIAWDYSGITVVSNSQNSCPSTNDVFLSVATHFLTFEGNLKPSDLVSDATRTLLCCKELWMDPKGVLSWVCGHVAGVWHEGYIYETIRSGKKSFGSASTYAVLDVNLEGLHPPPPTSRQEAYGLLFFNLSRAGIMRRAIRIESPCHLCSQSLARRGARIMRQLVVHDQWCNGAWWRLGYPPVKWR